MDLIVRNAVLVTPSEIFKADLGVSGGKIRAIASHLTDSAPEIIEGEGMFLLPGAIDVHTHFHLPFGDTFSADDFYSGSVAAACGGVTSFIDFATQGPGQTVAEAIASRREEADGQAVIDYSFHAGITQANRETLREIPDLVRDGFPSLKLFTAYPNLRVTDAFLLEVLEEAKRGGALVGVHAENGDWIEALRERFVLGGRTAPIYHYLSRPGFVESEAVARVVRMAKALEAPLYVFHLASGEGLDAVAAARAEGFPVMAETCPHYLLLTAEKYKQPDGERFILSPALKEEADRARLWRGLACGEIDVVATDHCPFLLKEKKGPFHLVPNGIGGVETLLPLLYSEGVAKKRITMNRLVEVLSYQPARIFGLEGKGSLMPGKDADFVLLDPRVEGRIEASKQHSRCDHSPYEGWPLDGKIHLTVSRGKVVARDGEFLGRKGNGRFLPRKRSR